jgi:hypothetical protein
MNFIYSIEETMGGMAPEVDMITLKDRTVILISEEAIGIFKNIKVLEESGHPTYSIQLPIEEPPTRENV